MLKQAALTSFDDTGSKDLEIEVVTQEITRLFRQAESQLQRFGDQRSASEADDKVRLLCSSSWPGCTSRSCQGRMPTRAP